MIIDAHQHVWDLHRSSYHWLSDDLASINRTIDFAEARTRFAESGIDATILVQSDDTDGDTDAMFDVQGSAREVVGVVGYVPLHDPDLASDRLAVLQQREAFCGVRNLIHDRPDPDWLLRKDVDAGLGLLEEAGVPFDVVAVLPRHLEVLIEVGKRHPDLRMVIDHLAKPPIGAASRDPWWGLVAEAAQNPNVYGKVSGLYATGHDPAAWTVKTMRPFVEHALEVFGVDRLMYGGDWPVSIIAGDYGRVWQGLREVLSHLDPRESARLFGGTAQEFYDLNAHLLVQAGSASD